MIYIASPYTDVQSSVMEERFQAAQRYTMGLLREGVPAFSPIVYGHQFAAHGFGHTALDWIDFNMNLLYQAEALHVLQLPGWDKSLGVRTEIAVAKVLGMRIEFVVPGDA